MRYLLLVLTFVIIHAIKRVTKCSMLSKYAALCSPVEFLIRSVENNDK